MKSMFRWLQKTPLKRNVLGFLLGCCVTTPIFADDIEIYTDIGGAVAQPNIMFVMDSSLNMDANIPATVPYEYGHDPAYVGDYDADRIYYTVTGAVPDTGDKNFYWASNNCDHAERSYDEFGVPGAAETGPLYTTGRYFGQLAQFDDASNKLDWRALTNSNEGDWVLPIECKEDHGNHGSNASTSDYYITDDVTTGWSTVDTGVADALWPDIGTNYYYLYTGDYLNYLVDPAVVGDTVQISMFEQLKGAIETMVTFATNINIGLMQYDSTVDDDPAELGIEGGSVQYPMLDVNAPAGDFLPRLSAMATSTNEPDSPIAETYFEALSYFGGGTIYYGDLASPSTNGDAKGSDGNYKTPITEDCQKNYIIMVSNGLSSYDYIDATKRASLPGFDVDQCNTNAYSDTYDSNYYDMTDDASMAASSDLSVIDNCMDEMAGWALVNDVATRADIDAHEGDQNITTYTVGFAVPDGSAEHLAGEQLLRDTAEKGGGRFIEAADQAGLERAFSDLIAEILKVNSTFSSPAVSVNAFNRATNLDDLYFTLFKPTEIDHWEGNLKKFKLEFDANSLPFIADVNSDPAIDSDTGFFKDSSLSYWTVAADTTTGTDGAETAEGGAASLLAVPRNVYTYNGAYANDLGVLTPSVTDLTAATNGLLGGYVTYDSLGITSDEAIIPTPYFYLGTEYSTNYYTSLIYWASGYDMLDDYTYYQPRRVMGDPLHAEPALVQYGLTAADEPDLVAYVATNDGYLHAFNTLTGLEYFAFIPQEMLSKIPVLYEDRLIDGKSYGLDGNVVSWINDANSDGDVLDTGEHVYLYFGMRRGGRYIYSMDVTDRNNPQLRWVIDGGADDYAELGQTWSAPNVEKIKTGVDADGEDTYRVVLIFGAGYDTGQDLLTTRGVDSVGRGVMIVDAESGELIWSAGPGGSADLQLTDMVYSIPARIKPLDINGDGYVDTLFAGDMGGQIWRFDIDNDSNTASTISVAGGLVANFAVDDSVNDNRRFYSPPDVAMIIEEGHAPYLAIVAASGYRAHPLQTDTHDRVYMFRDYNIYSAPASYTTITDADLYNATANDVVEGTDTASELDALATADGWYISLEELDGSFVGEKALSEPLILNGVVIFTTYFPASAGLSSNTCIANDGSGAIYFVNVVDATPTGDRNGDGSSTRADRRTLLTRGGIPPTPRVIITEDGIPTLCVGTECTTADDVGTVQKMYWYEVEG